MIKKGENMQTSSFMNEFQFGDKVEVGLMLETENTKEIRIVMPKGTVMKEHKAPGAIVVQVLTGAIWFEVDAKRHEFQTGDMLSLDALIPHSLGGIEDSVLRLSLSKIDDVARVRGVLKK